MLSIKNSRFYQLLYINLLPWLKSRRTMALLLVILAYIYLISNDQIQGFLRYSNMPLGQTEAFFVIMTDVKITLALSMFYFIMIAEIPKQSSYQYQTLLRASKFQWLGAQAVYCALLSLLTLGLITIILYGSACLAAPLNFGWENSVRDAQNLPSIMPLELIEHFTPLQSVLLTLLPLFLFWMTLGIVILFFSLLGIQAVAFALIGFVLSSPYIVFYGETTPIEFVNFHSLLNKGFEYYWPTMLGIVGLNLLLILGMFLYIKYIDLRFDTQNKQL